MSRSDSREYLGQRVGPRTRAQPLVRVEGDVVDALGPLLPVRGDLLNAGSRVEAPEANAAVVRSAEQVLAGRVEREAGYRVLVGDHAVHLAARLERPEAYVLVLVRGHAEAERGLEEHAVYPGPLTYRHIHISFTHLHCTYIHIHTHEYAICTLKWMDKLERKG